MVILTVMRYFSYSTKARYFKNKNVILINSMTLNWTVKSLEGVYCNSKFALCVPRR